MHKSDTGDPAAWFVDFQDVWLAYNEQLLEAKNFAVEAIDLKVRAGEVLATWDPHTRPIITEYAGFIKFENVEEGITVAKQIDDVTGLSSLVVIDPKQRAGQT